MSETWTAARVKTLKDLHKQGLSASRIAVLLGGGVTRNGVIGKVHRLGLARLENVSRATAALQTKITKAARGTAPVPAEPKVIPIRPVRTEPVAFTGPSKLLADLQRGECRWPLNDPGSGHMERTLFCASPGATLLGEGPPYCEAHSRLARGKPWPLKAKSEPSPLHRRAS